MNKATYSEKDQIWICERNIERFLKRLEAKLTPDERITAMDLLEKEEAKLLQLKIGGGLLWRGR